MTAAENYPTSTQARIKALDALISDVTQVSQKRPARGKNAGTLLTAFNALAAAEKVFLCTGANSADGRIDTDGPVGTAMLAYALYQAGKVATVVADRTNCALVQEILEKLDPDVGRYLRYVQVHAVNGVLVDAMYTLIEKHKPQAIVHIGVPGRTHDGLYLDMHGASIGEYNIALDQIMDIANALARPTIAVGTGSHQAGLGGSSDDAAPARTTLRAQHQVLAGSATLGALALAEMLSAAYADTQACDPKLLETVMELAKACRDKPEYKARPVREGAFRSAPRPARIAQSVKPIYSHATEAFLQYASQTGLPQIHESVHGMPLAWPQEIEEAKLYGRTCRYVALVDSSMGGRIAAKPFRNFVRARSPLDVRLLCVSDDEKAPYGTKCDRERAELVYLMLRHASRQGTEIIAMACNTACLEDMNLIAQRIQTEAAAEGRKLVVHIIDLIDTTSRAIIERGGARPTLLSTEATQAKGRYPEKIRELSQGNAEQQDVLVIAAGDKSNPELKDLDWPTLVNKLYHLMKDKPTVTALLRKEVRRYVERIPLNSTSVWLVCTHFPALRELIDEILAELLHEAGYTHKIPIFDPIADQAEALIAWTEKHKASDKTAFQHLPVFAVQTTAPVIDIVESVAQTLTPETVVTRVQFDDKRQNGGSRLGVKSLQPRDRHSEAATRELAQANAVPNMTESAENQPAI